MLKSSPLVSVCLAQAASDEGNRPLWNTYHRYASQIDCWKFLQACLLSQVSVHLTWHMQRPHSEVVRDPKLGIGAISHM